MKDIVENTVWTKTKELIFDKYGKNIEFKSLNLSLGRSPFYLNGDDLVIPLNSKSINLGEVIVNRGSLLTSEQKNEILDLIQFLIEPHVYNKHLKLKEEIENYKKQNHNQSEENVYSLFSEEDDLIVKLISSVIHLKSASPMSRKKVALKIHEMAEQDLFISFSEIESQIVSTNDLAEFSKTTIFVESLENLSAEKTKLLGELASSRMPGVLFLIGSNMTEAIIEKLSTNQAFKNDLLGIMFDVDRVPVTQQTNEDVLELLFFNVDQSVRS